MKLSEKLKKLRESSGETQEQVCEVLGIGIQTLRNYENDKLDRIPNSYQLKKLKEHFNVTYEYLLDDECTNRTTETINIGNTLKLSDKSIQKIKDLQFNNPTFLPAHLREVTEDTSSPYAFNEWIENFSSIKSFAIMLDTFYTLNRLSDKLQCFASILDIYPYIKHCLSNNKSKLNSLFEYLEQELEELKFYVSDGEKSSLNYSHYEELKIEYEKFKKYCNSYDKNNFSTDKLDIDDELYIILNTILEIALDFYLVTNKDLRYCQFEIIELFKNSLYITSEHNEKITPPAYFEYLKLSIKNKGGENN